MWKWSGIQQWVLQQIWQLANQVDRTSRNKNEGIKLPNPALQRNFAGLMDSLL